MPNGSMDETVAEADLESYLRAHPASIEGWGGSYAYDVGDVDAESLGRRDAARLHVHDALHCARPARDPGRARANGTIIGSPCGRARNNRSMFGARSPRHSNIEEADVRVIVPDTGGGFGGKHEPDVAIAAARLARAAGVPVKLQWTREEEFTWAYFRPAADHRHPSRRDVRRRHHVMGAHQHQRGECRNRRSVRRPEPAAALPTGRLTVAARSLPSTRRDREQLRPRIAPSTSSRTHCTSTRCNSGCATYATNASPPCSERAAEHFGWERPARAKPGVWHRDSQPGSRRADASATCVLVRVDDDQLDVLAHRDGIRVRRDRRPRQPRATRSRAPPSWASAARCSKQCTSTTGASSTHRSVNTASRASPTCHPSKSSSSTAPTSLGRRRRNTDHHHRTRSRQRDLRRDPPAPPLPSAPRSRRVQRQPRDDRELRGTAMRRNFVKTRAHVATVVVVVAAVVAAAACSSSSKKGAGGTSTSSSVAGSTTIPAVTTRPRSTTTSAPAHRTRRWSPCR